MLPKKNRLGKKEINELKKDARIIQGQFFGLIFKPGQESKFGLIISNNISKKATERNKTKRLLFGAVKKRLSLHKGSFLFLAKKNSLSLDHSLVEREVETLLGKITRFYKNK